MYTWERREVLWSCSSLFCFQRRSKHGAILASQESSSGNLLISQFYTSLRQYQASKSPHSCRLVTGTNNGMWIDPAFGTGVHVKLTDSGSRTDFVHLQPVVESFEILKIEHKISNTFFVILSTDLKY